MGRMSVLIFNSRWLVLTLCCMRLGTLLISNVFSQTIISALDECEKQGKFCPRLSTCEKNGTYDCVCIKGLRMVNKSQDRICEGTRAFTIFFPIHLQFVSDITIF